MSAKPPQESLDFGRLYRVTDSVRGLYRALNDAVDSIGILPAAGACGIDRGDLRRSLDRDGRRVAAEHAMAIAAITHLHARLPGRVAGFSCSTVAPPEKKGRSPPPPFRAWRYIAPASL